MRYLVAFVLALVPHIALADLAPRAGWEVVPTQKTFDQLVADTRAAVKANGMIVVTQAGPTKAAKARGIDIPGNRVIGVFNNQFAVRVLRLSEAAMIEAPIRLYVTENDDETATLSYKTPTHVFAPYIAQAGKELADEASKLDQVFAAIAQDALK